MGRFDQTNLAPKRSRRDHLSPPEVEALHRAIRLGGTVETIAARFNLNPRTVQVHRKKLGLSVQRRIEPTEDADKSAYGTKFHVKRICCCEGCLSLLEDGQSFCFAHQYRRPDNAAKLMAGKA